MEAVMVTPIRISTLVMRSVLRSREKVQQGGPDSGLWASGLWDHYMYSSFNFSLVIQEVIPAIRAQCPGLSFRKKRGGEGEKKGRAICYM